MNPVQRRSGCKGKDVFERLSNDLKFLFSSLFVVSRSVEWESKGRKLLRKSKAIMQNK